jgi:hypothetical protein
MCLCGGFERKHDTPDSGASLYEATHLTAKCSPMYNRTVIVCVLLGISPASDCDLPTFRNPLSVPSSKAGCRVLSGWWEESVVFIPGPRLAWAGRTNRGGRNQVVGGQSGWVKKGLIPLGHGTDPEAPRPSIRPFVPPNYRHSLLHLQRRLAPSGARAYISEGGNWDNFA